MNQFLSKKISFFSCLGTFMVLLMHSQDKNGSCYDITSWLYFIFVELFANSAVPIFFVISGLLFFKENNISFNDIKNKIQKRIFSLGIPFLCATVFYILFCLLLYIVPYARNYINGDIFYELRGTFFAVINRCFINYPNIPIAGQLWYLRDLLIIVICSPLLLFFFKSKFRCYFLLFLFLFASFNCSLSLYSSFFWFSLGGIIHFIDVDWVLNRNKSNYIIITLFIYWAIFIVFHIYNITIPYYCELFILCIRVVLLWYTYDILELDYVKKIIPRISPYVFFIFLFHQPDINIIRKIPMICLGKSDFSYSLSFLMTPFICGFILLVIARFLKFKFCSMYSFIVGGR